MEDSELLNQNQSLEIKGESPRGPLKKTLYGASLTVVFLTGFIAGLLYFLNFGTVIQFVLSKQGMPVEIDKLDVGIGGGFEFERVRYPIQNPRGVSDKIQFEYGKGDLSFFSYLFSDTVSLDARLTGVKIPLESGVISGGNWTIKTSVTNVSKIAQQWSGTVEVEFKNVNVQYKVMETSYVALIRDGKVKGRILNGFLTLEPAQINADIARLTISGNAGVVNPYNLNLQISILPSGEFETKYPGEYSMLKGVMQEQQEIIIALSGPANQVKPRVQNINLPRF